MGGHWRRNALVEVIKSSIGNIEGVRTLLDLITPTGIRGCFTTLQDEQWSYPWFGGFKIGSWMAGPSDSLEYPGVLTPESCNNIYIYIYIYIYILPLWGIWSWLFLSPDPKTSPEFAPVQFGRICLCKVISISACNVVFHHDDVTTYLSAHLTCST